MALPLSGIRLLDFTHLLPGELCATVLGDLGCDVIRIEPILPGLGTKLPPVVQGESLYYWSVHRNKKRIAIDLKSAEGKAIAHKFIETADGLVENFRPGVMRRLGCSYTEAHRINPSLVYCSISGYGHDNSWSDRPGHDMNLIAESGILDFTRAQNGRPVLPGALVSDYTSGLYAALAVVSALFARGPKGTGKHIDISMFESALSTQQIMATSLLFLNKTREEVPFCYPVELPHYSVYECADGRYIAIAPLEMPFWNTFCERTQMFDLQNHVVQKNEAHISERIAKVFCTKSLADWMQIFEGSNCCVSPVNTVTEALHTEAARERNLLTQLEHPTLGSIPQIASPMLTKQERKNVHSSVSASDKEATKALKDLGYSTSEIKRLCEEKIIQLRHQDQPKP